LKGEKAEKNIAGWYALASQLESIGQYNNAKLIRSAAESITRRRAYQIQLTSDNSKLVQELRQFLTTISEKNECKALSDSLERGISALESGRLALFEETPNPYVCRTCGQIIIETHSRPCPQCGAQPNTFIHYQPVYWLDNFDPFEALESLHQAPKDLADYLNQLTDEQLQWTPAEGEWSIRNTVSHIRDAQGVLEFRLELMIKEDNPELESKAVFEWAAQESERPPATIEIYQSYYDSRQKVLSILEALPIIEWWRTGEHEEFGQVSIMQQVSYFATHELTHFPQIENLIRQITEF
jgi:rubrerythrin